MLFAKSNLVDQVEERLFSSIMASQDDIPPVPPVRMGSNRNGGAVGGGSEKKEKKGLFAGKKGKLDSDGQRAVAKKNACFSVLLHPSIHYLLLIYYSYILLVL